jgi:hypothetical protein
MQFATIGMAGEEKQYFSIDLDTDIPKRAHRDKGRKEISPTGIFYARFPKDALLTRLFAPLGFKPVMALPRLMTIDRGTTWKIWKHQFIH